MSTNVRALAHAGGMIAPGAGEPPAGEGRFWLACEATVMRHIRRHVLDGWALEPSSMVTRGYWKYGETNYRDGDYGED